MPSRRENFQLQERLFAGMPPPPPDAKAQLSPQAFPSFVDGDVRIVITGARQYYLHASTLKTHSPVFARLLDDRYSAKLSKQAIKRGVVVRNRLDAVQNGEDHDGLPQLTLQPVALDQEGRPVNAAPVGLDLENGVAVPPIYTAWHIVLGLFYHQPINFGQSSITSLFEILTTANLVLKVAEYLDVVDMLTAPFQATLLSTGQILFKSIANDPALWLDFARRIKSPAIWREALIHAAGQYNTQTVQTAITTGLIKPPITEFLHQKAEELKERVKMSLKRAMSYYPHHLHRESILGLADAESYGRNSYSKDIFSWMALTAFRHYVSQHLANDQTHHAVDMGFELIEAMAAGGDAYCDKTSLIAFHEFFPMSNKGMQVVQNKILEIKEHVKSFVWVLMQNKSQRQYETTQTIGNLFGYSNRSFFTCTIVEEADYPWMNETKLLREPSLGEDCLTEDPAHDSNEEELDGEGDAEAGQGFPPTERAIDPEYRLSVEQEVVEENRPIDWDHLLSFEHEGGMGDDGNGMH